MAKVVFTPSGERHVSPARIGPRALYSSSIGAAQTHTIFVDGQIIRDRAHLAIPVHDRAHLLFQALSGG